MKALVSGLGAMGLLLVFNGLTASSRPRRSLLSGLERRASDAGWHRVGGSGLALMCAGLALSAALAAFALTSSEVLALAGLVAGAHIPLSAVKRAGERRRRAAERAWPDAITGIISGIRAGIALPECCRALASSGPEELRAPFRSFASTYTASGSFEAGLRRLSDELREPIADRVVAVLSMTHQVGGSDVVRVLQALVHMIREDLRIRDEVKARWSWTVTAARVAAAVPFLVLILMGVTPEGALAYRTPEGVGTVAVGLTCTWLGYRLMLRAGRLPDHERLSR